MSWVAAAIARGWRLALVAGIVAAAPFVIRSVYLWWSSLPEEERNDENR